jgi:hypothetical protein
MADDENTMQRALYQLHKVTNSYNLEISIENTKVMAFTVKQPMRSKLLLENQVIGQVRKFNFLGSYVSYLEVDINNKIGRLTICLAL